MGSLGDVKIEQHNNIGKQKKAIIHSHNTESNHPFKSLDDGLGAEYQLEAALCTVGLK